MRLPLAGLALLLAACSPDAPAVEEETSPISEVTFDSEIMGSEVATILTEGGEVRLGLTDQVLYFGLTPQVSKQVETELEDAEAEGGLGGFIAGAVSNAVTGVLTTPVQIPLENIDDIRYENGRLEIDFNGEHSTADIEIDDEPVDQQFDPEEARQFAEAFHELTGR